MNKVFVNVSHPGSSLLPQERNRTLMQELALILDLVNKIGCQIIPHQNQLVENQYPTNKTQTIEGM